MTLQFNMQSIHDSLTPPPLFERGEPMWHDPYIAKQMLTFHLNETHDIASRRPETIDRIVEWIRVRASLKPGKHLLDLGCGPGLYTRRFSQIGLQVTGIDYSQNSIDYAKNHDTQSTYIYQNYVEMDFPDACFDVVMMIYGDFCVLSQTERDNLLKKVHRMLKSGGYFVFDVTQPQAHSHIASLNTWSIAPNGGFWKPDPYLVLEQGFVYDDNITMEQYIVIEADGTQTLYRNWFQDYTQATLLPILESFGYNEVDVYGDLTGSPYREPDDWMGIVAKKSSYKD